MTKNTRVLYAKLAAGTPSTIARRLSSLTVAPVQLGPLLNTAYQRSEPTTLNLCRGVLRQRGNNLDNNSKFAEMLLWANQKGRKAQRIVAEAFRNEKNCLLLVSNIGRMTQADARSFMLAYFDANGDMRSIAQYLALAGRVLRSRSAQPAGFQVMNFIGDIAGDVAELFAEATEAVSETIETVVDAVVSAGKRLSDVLHEAAVWSVTQLADLTMALLDAGQQLGDILTQALEIGLLTLKGFVSASIMAGQQMVDVLRWAQGKAVEVLAITLDGLLAIGQTLASVVQNVCVDIQEGFREGFFQGLIAIGKGVLDILKAAQECSFGVLGIAFTVVLAVTGTYRELNKAERQEALRIFGASIDLDRVRVAESSLMIDAVNLVNGERPFTTMYYINFENQRFCMSDLIHELVHVWQGAVAGPVYMAQALESQFFGRGYQVTPQELDQFNGDFSRFEREQQAVIVEEYWKHRWGVAQPDKNRYGPYERYARAVFVSPSPFFTQQAIPLAQRQLFGEGALEPGAQKLEPGPITDIPRNGAEIYTPPVKREYHKLVPTLLDGRTINPQVVVLAATRSPKDYEIRIIQEFRRRLELARRKPWVGGKPLPWVETPAPIGPGPSPVTPVVPRPIPTIPVLPGSGPVTPIGPGAGPIITGRPLVQRPSKATTRARSRRDTRKSSGRSVAQRRRVKRSVG